MLSNSGNDGLGLGTEGPDSLRQLCDAYSRTNRQDLTARIELLFAAVFELSRLEGGTEDEKLAEAQETADTAVQLASGLEERMVIIERQMAELMKRRLKEAQFVKRVEGLEAKLMQLQAVQTNVGIDHDVLMFEVEKWRKKSTGSS